MAGFEFEKLYIAEKPSLGKAIAEAYVELLTKPGQPAPRIEQFRAAHGPTHAVVGGKIAIAWFYGHMLEQAYPQAYNPEFGTGFKRSAHLLPFIPTEWLIVPTKKNADQLSAVQKLCRRAKVIVNAGDPDPEGMLLIMEALEYFKVSQPVLRMLPNAMDGATIKKAIAEETDNANFITTYHRALGRSRSDYLVGINMSRACTASNVLDEMLSVGRVQTPTLALVVRRDLEIETFEPSKYYEPTPVFRHRNGSYKGRWVPPKEHPGLDKEGRLTDSSAAKKIVEDIAGLPGDLSGHTVTDASEAPPMPFSLPAIQAKANSLFGLTAKKTLDICQALYERHKVASYPRSDSGFLKESQFEEAPGVLAAVASLDPEIAKVVAGANTSIRSKAWNDKQVIAHHGIIPTALPNYSALSDDELKVFKLIVRNYIAQFYPNFEYKQTSVTTTCGGHNFKSSGRVPTREGWKTLFNDEKEKNADSDDKAKEVDESQDLPLMAAGDKVTCESAAAGEKTTKAPPRFTEARLLKAMQDVSDYVDDPVLKKRLELCKGIGTPATQASIIERLKEVGFIITKGKQLISTQGARDFILGLPDELTNPGLTAQWELALDRVEQGALGLDRYMQGIETWVSDLTRKTLESQISISLKKNAPLEQLRASSAGGKCGACEKGTMVPRLAKNGPNAGKYFLSCNAYPDCKNTENIEGQETPVKKRSGTGSSKKSSAGSSKSPAQKRTSGSGTRSRKDTGDD